MSDEKPSSQELLNTIVLEYMQDKKRKRRWRWIMWTLVFVAIGILSFQAIQLKEQDETLKSKPHVGLIDIDGGIFEGEPASADNFAKSLHKAYQNPQMEALIIRINSPGGSPVQADYMFSTLQHYKKKNPKIKTYAVCVDLCASAAYYLASAADEIYANPSSMVGSIGVLFNGFGFVGAMEKLGVTRRVQTAGINKDFLDPFKPENNEQKVVLQGMLDEVHQQFIAKVREGRGERLKENDTIFSGLFWTGLQAKSMGLIDGFASTGQLARETIKISNMVDYSQKQNFLERFAKGIGTSAVREIPIAFGFRSGLQ